MPLSFSLLAVTPRYLKLKGFIGSGPSCTVLVSVRKELKEARQTLINGTLILSGLLLSFK